MPVRIEGILRISLFALGFTALFTQIYLLREFMAILYGNELILGIVLANWMILTGLGAFLGSFFHRVKEQFSFLIFLQFLFSILPLLTTFRLDLWKAFSIPYGSMISLTTIFYTSFLILAPFCLLNGFLFVAYASFLSEKTGKNKYGKSYSLESFGSMTAGILVNFIFLWLFDNWISLRILLVLNLLVFLLFVWTSSRNGLKILLTPIALALMILPFFSNLQDYTDHILYPGQKLLSSKFSPYGKVVVTENEGQLNYYENGLLLFSSGNEIFNEEAIHFSMVQHPAPKDILLISGGIAGTLKEILKYNPRRIDYLEMNPAIIALGSAFSNTRVDQRIHVIEKDARRFLKTTIEKYDIVLINLPEPSTLQINRFYTLEFFRLIKSRLNPGAVISLGLPSTADYVSENAAQLNSTIYQTLQSVFKNIIILPGQKNYFIVSDAPIRHDIARLIKEKGISTQYVNQYYLDDDLLKDRSKFIVSQLTKSQGINHDLRPIGFFLQIKYWNSFFQTNYLIIGIALLIIFIVMGFSINSISLGLFSGGFTASSVEIILLIVFQSTYGYVFQMAGVIITLFMMGLAAGSWFQPKITSRSSFRQYFYLQISLGCFCAVLPFILLAINTFFFSDTITMVILGVLTLIVSFLTGMEFSVSTLLRIGNTANMPAKNYAADLFGSALGAIVISIFLIPLAGVVWSCQILVLLNLFSAGFLQLHRKKIVSL